MGASPVTPSEPPKQGALLRLFAKVEQDPIKVHEALEEVRDSSGENIRQDIAGLEVRTEARSDKLQGQTEAGFETTNARINELKSRNIDGLKFYNSAPFDKLENKLNARFDEIQRQLSMLLLLWIVGFSSTMITFFFVADTLFRD